MQSNVAAYLYLLVEPTLLNQQKLSRPDASFCFTIDTYQRFLFSDQWGRVANPRYFYKPAFCRAVLTLIRQHGIKSGRFFLDEFGLFRKGRSGERAYLR